MSRFRVGQLLAVTLIVGGVLGAPTAYAQPPDPDKASCVEQFNLAVGTPGEFQRVFHQAMLGRDVNFFARFDKEECPF